VNSLGFRAWDCFATHERNLGITHAEDIAYPKKRIFREFETKHEIIFSIEDTTGGAVVTMDLSPVALRWTNKAQKTSGAFWNVWMQFAEELHRLITIHEVQPFIDAEEEARDAAHEAKVTLLEEMDYASLLQFYNACPDAPKRRGLKKDRESLVRRLAKLGAFP